MENTTSSYSDYYDLSEDYINHRVHFEPDFYDLSDDTFPVEPVSTFVDFTSIAVPVLLFMVFVLSLIGNVLVLVILGRYESLKSSTNIFILNLALSDLLFTLGLPFWACNHIWGWNFGIIICKVVKFVFDAGFYSSIVFLMAMSIQRYIVVVHQLSNWDRGQMFAVLPVVVWLISIISTLPVLRGSYEDERYFCATISIPISYRQTVYFAVGFLVMIFCYIRILQITIKSPPHQKDMNLRLISCIGVLFLVLWAPYNIVRLVVAYIFYYQFYHVTSNFLMGLEKAWYVSEILALSHCCMKPFCYVLLDIKFRNHLKSIFQKRVTNSIQVSSV